MNEINKICLFLLICNYLKYWGFLFIFMVWVYDILFLNSDDCFLIDSSF